MGAKVCVIDPGLLTTIQDLGRFGYRQYGVVTSGAMDAFALRVANLLVGNEAHAAALETTLKGPTLKWLTDGWIAICGGDLTAQIDGEAVPLWRPIYVKRHSVLAFSYAQNGCRAYVALHGGIAVPEVLGSRSTHLHARLGGLEGRALQVGDILQAPSRNAVLDMESSDNPKSEKGAFDNAVSGMDCSDNAVSDMDCSDYATLETGSSYYAPPWFISYEVRPHYSARPVVRVIKSSEFVQFDEDSQHAFFKQRFEIKPQSDRMGIQLLGPLLQLREANDDRISGTVTMGTVQVPPSGEPIILMADGQTVGGYPVIAYVATVDLPLLAQLKPADSVQFTAITHHEAEALYMQRERELTMLEAGLNMMLGGLDDGDTQ